MSGPKITIIGGGSYMWGPTFIRDMVATPELQGSSITLHDLNPQSLDLVYALGDKLIRDFELPYTLRKTLSLEEALSEAQFVILTITTGGLEAMRHDLEIPQKYGIYQSVGDTVGPGGLARGLRNIPVVVDIARKMEALCPDAWLLNYTNPMSTLCRAVTRERRVKTIGLCHEFIGVRGKLAKLLSVEEGAIQTRVGGINHLTWILELKVDGQDAFPQLANLASHILTGRLVLEDDPTSMIDRAMIKSRLFQIYSAVPAAGDRHVAEFFPHFITEATGWGDKYGIRLTSVEERHQWSAQAHALIQSALRGETELGPFLLEHSGEAASEIIAAVTNHREYTGIMNLPNSGQIANLPRDSVVETLGIIDSTGARGIAMGDLPPGIQAVVARHIDNQEMVVEAALTGDRRLALQALLNDPLVRGIDQAESMLAEMIMANKTYLPQF